MHIGKSDMNRKSIVVVEDDDVFRTRLLKALSARGLQGYGAKDLQELSEVLAQESPDFAVLDLKLGRESGLEALRLVKERHSNCKALILTGYGTISTAVEAMKQGAFYYLTKPVNADKILEVLSDKSIDLESGEVKEVPVPSLNQLEWEHIQSVLKDCKGNITHAAKALGMHRRSLQRKLAKSPGPLV